MAHNLDRRPFGLRTFSKRVESREVAKSRATRAAACRRAASMGERADKTPAGPAPTTAAPANAKKSVHEVPAPSELDRLVGVSHERVSPLPPVIDLGSVPLNQEVYLDVGRLRIRDGFAGSGTVVTELIDEHLLDGDRPSYYFKPVPLLLGTGPGDDMLRVKFRSDRPGGFDAKLVAKVYWSDELLSVRITKIRAKVPRANTATSTPAPAAREAARDPVHEAPHAAARSPVHEDAHQQDAPPKWHLALPDRIEFDDIAVGKTTTASAHVLHRDRPDQQGPRITARVIGNDGITLVSAPLFLLGAARPPSEADAFKLRYHRMRAEQPKGALEIQILDNPQETFRIPFSAGVPEIVRDVIPDPQRVAAERQRDGAALETSARATRTALEGDVDFHPGMKELFDQAKGRVKEGMSYVGEGHTKGVDQAQAEAEAFKRIPPNADKSFIERLAPPAIEIAFAAVAGSVGKRFENNLKDGGFGLAAIGFLVDGLKQLIKTSGKPVGDVGGPGTAKPPTSGSMLREFFETQSQLVLDTDHHRGNHLVDTVANTLLPSVMRSAGQKGKPPDASKAIAKLDAIAQALTSEGTHAMNVQKAESTRAWINFLTAPVVNGGPRNAVTDQTAKFDGLLDFRGTASQNFPANAVRIDGVRMLGVGKTARQLMYERRLEDVGVPIRLVLTLRDTPGRTVTILRTASGGVQFEDENNSGTSWFGRRIGNPRLREDEEREVADKLLTELLLGRTLHEFAPSLTDLEHDGVDE